MKILKESYNRKPLVKADIVHLRKLFIMPDSPDKFLEFGHDLLDLIHQFFADKGAIHSAISLEELAKIFSNIEIPNQPHLLKDVLLEIKKKIIAHSVKVANPYYIGHMTSAIPYFSILLEMIIAALNQNQVKIETAKASSFVERELIAWIHRLIFDLPPQYYKKNIQNHNVALGNVTTDGTIANLTAMLVARNKAFPPDGRFPGIKEAGVYEAYRHYNCKKAVILVSTRGHYSISKAATILGIGEDNVIKIPVDLANKIDLDKLRKVCSDIREENEKGGEKIKIISLIGIGGTTETGNIDRLYDLKKIADENKTYFHVDAAWGGSTLLVDRYKFLLRGIEQADSVTFDAHKLLYSPLSMGMILFRKETDLNYIKHTAEYILRPDSVDQGRFTVEGSRAFSCLKPWAAFKVLGAEGFRFLFQHAFRLTASLWKLVEDHPNFEALCFPELFIFNYRFVPSEVQDKLKSLRKAIREKGKDDIKKYVRKVEKINDILNDLNIDLHRKQRDADNSFVSRTVLESTRYSPQNIVVLRTVTVNPLTTNKILKEIIAEQDKIGRAIYKSGYKKSLDKI